MRGRILYVSPFACLLLGICFSVITNSSDGAQSLSGQRLPARQLAQDVKQQERANKRESFKSGRQLLLEHGVPFDPDILLEGNWKERLSPALAAMPEFQDVREGAKKMEGVQLADTLLLPEQIELTGNTVVIARQLVFMGKNPIIKGPYDLTFFTVNRHLALDTGLEISKRKGSSSFANAGFSTASLLDSALERGLLVKPESITINVDGLGRDEWIKNQSDALRNNYSHHVSRINSALAVSQNIDKDSGATGQEGQLGASAVEPPEAAQGPPGHCGASHPDGFIGDNGNDASVAGTGGIGGRGYDGDNGGTLTASIPSGSETYHFSARGGRGGQGGPGGPGGLPARGGKGGKGGPGAECDCPQNSGTGGQGGKGGKGSTGGTGGQGGPGAIGGRGGTINLTIACDYNGAYSTNVNGGGEGPPGMPGPNSAGGAWGFGGDPGPGARNILCLSLGGNDGGAGQSGLPGDNTFVNGQLGTVGSHGPAGTVSTPVIDEAPCSGGGGCQGGEVMPTCDPPDQGSLEHCCCMNGGVCTSSPVVIDVEGNGFVLTDAVSGVNFDLNVDGAAERLSWTTAGSDDAWLALDRNRNGRIDNGLELFGNHTPQPQAIGGKNGFLALAVYDKTEHGGNSDGQVSRSDSVFDLLRVWQDANHNGVSESTELVTLTQAGISILDLKYKESRRTDEYGNRFRYRAKVKDVHGEQVGRWAWDVFLTTQ